MNYIKIHNKNHKKSIIFEYIKAFIRHMSYKKHIIYFFLLILNFQEFQGQEYSDIRKKYENLNENDRSALKYVNEYIYKAKKEKNGEQIIEGYKDAIYYTYQKEKKMQYSDSCLAVAFNIKDEDLISSSYLTRGSIYYFDYKNYTLALNDYIKAYHYSKTSNDLYLKHKLIYQIGVLKSYLGYYREALNHFKNCIGYFDEKRIGGTHPNEIYNYTKGYLNSIHQSIVCYRNLKQYKKADSLISVGLNNTTKTREYLLERSYFEKCKGILEYHKKNYSTSLEFLNKSLPEIRQNNDFAWVSVADFYIGKNYVAQNKKDQSIPYFKKVDSIFKKNQFIVPELRENYEQLINYYKEKNDTQKELYYTKILLNVDKILSKDFTYLSSRIHKEYDTENLLETQDRLEIQKKWGLGALILLIIISIGLIFLVWKYNENEKRIQERYKKLEERLQSQRESPNTLKENSTKKPYNEVKHSEILKKLEIFEQNNEFIEKGLTLNKLAKKLETNSTYLSQVINEKRNQNFTRYLSELRINYITQLIYYDKKFLKYTIEALADECGIAYRQNFSDLFQEINGMRPKDFIKQRKAELQ